MPGSPNLPPRPLQALSLHNGRTACQVVQEYGARQGVVVIVNKLRNSLTELGLLIQAAGVKPAIALFAKHLSISRGGINLVAAGSEVPGGSRRVGDTAGVLHGISSKARLADQP